MKATASIALFAGALAITLTASGCGVGEGTGSQPPWADPPTPRAASHSAPPVEETAGGGSAAPSVVPYRVRMTTSKGDVVIAVHPEWAPRGAARFKELVEAGYYDDNRIFRVVPGFVVQFGMNGDPKINARWDDKPIRDDRVREHNARGTVTFATSGADARTTQVFINLADNPNLDTMPQNFAPFGEVVEGMDVVDSFNSEYAEAPTGTQGRIAAAGNAFLDEKFPGLDSIVKAAVVDESVDAGVAGADRAAADNAVKSVGGDD